MLVTLGPLTNVAAALVRAPEYCDDGDALCGDGRRGECGGECDACGGIQYLVRPGSGADCVSERDELWKWSVGKWGTG